MLDRTLASTWVLHGRDVPALAAVVSRAHAIVVADVEHLCAAIVVDVSRSDAPYVPRETCDLYDALGYLLGRVVEVTPRYDPTRGRRLHDPWTAGFKAWLHDELVRDLHDHWRSWNGRSGHKRLPTIDHEERRALGDDDVNDVRSARERRLRGAADAVASDRGDVGLDALRRRFLEGGDRALLREVEALGLGTDTRARGRAEGADRGGKVGCELVKAAA